MNFDDAPLKGYLIARESVLEADKNINIILEKTKLYQMKYPIEVKVFTLQSNIKCKL